VKGAASLGAAPFQLLGKRFFFGKKEAKNFWMLSRGV
jgi:hypothetical protein